MAYNRRLYPRVPDCSNKSTASFESIGFSSEDRYLQSSGLEEENVRKLRIYSIIFVLLCTATIGFAQEAPELIMLDKEYKAYLTRSAGEDWGRRTELWIDLVETPHDELYKSFVWRQTGPEGKRRMMTFRQDTLRRQEELVSETLELYEVFPKVLDREIAAFQRLFPELSTDFKVYLFPSFSFNGKTGSLKGSQALLFGADVIAERDDHLGVLFLHELFHIYHEQLQQEPFDESKVTLTFPLWAEGLATQVTHRYYPEEDYLMDPDLLRLDRAYLPVLAKEFLKVANMGTDSPGVENVYRLWFKSGTPERVRPGLPNRLGYLLGDEVIAELNKSYSIDTMARWNPREAHHFILIGLKRVATR